MKTTQDYFVGNTAIQIVRTGRKIKVVDVEREARRRKIVKELFITVIVGILVLVSSFYVVHLHNKEELLDRQNYSLQYDIESLERKNSIIEKNIENMVLDYNDILKKAKKLGMRFPKKNQKYTYNAKKSTLVRVHPGISGKKR